MNAPKFVDLSQYDYELNAEILPGKSPQTDNGFKLYIWKISLGPEGFYKNCIDLNSWLAIILKSLTKNLSVYFNLSYLNFKASWIILLCDLK